jgi:hypothetical protein
MDIEAKRRSKKKPLNQQRRMKQMLEKEETKQRGKMPPPTKRHKDKRREKRQDTKRKMRDYTSMDRNYIANELLKAAKEMMAHNLVGHSRSAASAKAIGKYFKLEKHLKQNGDREGLSLLEDLADALRL